jgi:hypothetical protein
MKTAYRLLLLLPTAFAINAAVTGNFDLEIHCVAKPIDQKVNKGSGDGGVNETRERWVYDVTVENKTFKDLANLDVKYVIFFTQEQLGVKATPAKRQQSGSFTIDVLRSHQKKMFSTNPIELHKSNLVGHWIYTDGAKPNAQDKLAGLAVRVYQGGQLFAEFANPSTFLREKVE